MSRSTRNTVLLAKIETTSGTDSAPTNTTDAVLLLANNASMKVEQKMATRDPLRGTFGAPDMLPYTRRGTVTFSVDLAGSGTAGTAPAWEPLLRACAFAGTVTAASRVDYTPVSTGIKTVTLWGYMDGDLRKFTYCAGTVKLGLSSGKSPTLDFSFTCLVSSVTAAAVPTPTLSTWITPQAIGPAFTSGMTIGGTYSAGVISGGTTYNWLDCNADVGNSLQDLPLIAQEAINIDNRASKMDVTMDLTAAQAVAFYADMAAGTPRSIGFSHGTVAGNKVMLFAPQARITAIDDAPQGNTLLTKLSLDLLPTSAGNDELRLVTF